jgi:glycosyltransferase involved in cell wall biosynthesis
MRVANLGNHAENAMGDFARSHFVSVIVPTFNSERTLEDCLESIMNQTYGNIETLIVDKYSSDETLKIAHKYGAKSLFKGPERSSQKNWGAVNAKGVFLYFVDSDFVLEPDAVEKCVSLCERYDGVTTVNYSVGKSLWGRSIALKEQFLAHDPTIQNVRFVRKDVFSRIGGFDEELVVGEDLDLYRRLLDSGFRIGASDAVEWHVGEPETLKDIIRRSLYYGKVVKTYLNKRKGYAVRQLSPFKPNLVRLLVKSGSPYLFSLIIVDVARWMSSLLGFVVDAGTR